MKRMHVHVSVEDLAQSISFYSTLFATRQPYSNLIMRNGCWMIRA